MKLTRSSAFVWALMLAVVVTGVGPGCAPTRSDKLVFVSPDGTEHDVMPEAARNRKRRARGGLRPAVAGLDRPNAIEEFHRFWHTRCISQEATGQCWAFSSTSFMESELKRLLGREACLSQAWTVYWDYVGKAQRFIEKKGDSFFANGSEPNSILRVWQEHGIVPFDAYTGLTGDQKHYNDGALYREMTECLNKMKEKNEWDEARGLAAIREILDRHMGAPPEKFEYEGTSLTPQEYRQKYANLELGDYVTVLSLMQEPWYEWVLYDVPDNWWRSQAYYNVPLTDFTRVIRDAVRRGRTVCLLEDVSEAGFYGQKSIAIVPSFDIPSAYITDSARQFRFSNGTTGDDHAVHVIGWTQRGGKYWYLVKDSARSPRQGKFGGYMFYDEDYIRLKVLAFMVERGTVEQTLGRKLGPAPVEKMPTAVTASAGS